MELISVIVPVFKVEKYLRKCIDSIIAQTYTNLEIILVDDGSPDNCGKICDEYADSDARIKVIHQENKGVSAARNVGISNATGKFIGFIDSDDFPESNMFEELYNCLIDNQSDISICGFKRFGIFSKTVRYKTKCINKDEFLKELLSENLTSYLCNKLFKKKLFNSIVFPEGEIFEDIKILHLIGEKASSVSFTEKTFYNYRAREHSITSESKGKVNEWITAAHSRSERYKNTKYYPYAVAGEFRCLRVIVSEMDLTEKNKDNYKQLLDKSKNLYKICKHEIKGFQRFITRIYLVSPRLYSLIKKIYLFR